MSATSPQIEERAREAWSFPRIETFVQDLRYGLRGIRRSPGFSLVVILTLALGIGANTAIFSVVNSVLLRPLPYPAAERLVWLGESDPKAEGISVTWVNYQHWRNENHSFEEMAGFRTAHLTLTGRGEPLFTRAGVVTSGFFRLVGAKPLLGRLFNASEDRPGGTPTVVLSHQFWVDKLGADPRVRGRSAGARRQALRSSRSAAARAALLFTTGRFLPAAGPVRRGNARSQPAWIDAAAGPVEAAESRWPPRSRTWISSCSAWPRPIQDRRASIALMEFFWPSPIPARSGLRC